MKNKKKIRFENKILIIVFSFLFTAIGFSQDYHWQFNDDQVNSTNGLTTLEGTNPEMFIPGKINKALSIKKNHDSFPFSNNVSLGNTGSYSLSFWINPSSFPESGEEYFIINKREGVQQFQAFINRFEELEFYVYGGVNEYVRVVCNKKLPLNRWSNIIITVSNVNNNRFATIYFNGNQVNQQPFYFTPNTASTKVVFGSKYEDGNQTNGITHNLNGTIDSFRISGGRVFSFSEIQTLANKNQSPDYRWKFDEYLTQNEDYSISPIAKDYIGYKDGEIQGVIPRVEGKVGYSAAYFKKNEQNYITVNDVETPNSKTYSLSFWIKPIDDFPSSSSTILKKRDSKNQYQVTLLSNGKIRFHLWGNNYLAVTSSSISADEWTNIIIIVNNINKKVSLYKNGALDVNPPGIPYIFEPWFGVDTLIIGDQDSVLTSDFILDDVRIYNNKILDNITIAKIAAPSELPSAVNAPIKYQNYYKTAYRLYDYDPNFIPGPVSFDNDNIPYIRKENYVQTIENGKWVRLYFDNQIILDALEGWGIWDEKFDNSEANDTRIVFDDEGWAYTFITTNINTHHLVLYSTDKCRTWKALNKHIRWKNVLWETNQIHSDLNLPPVLLSSENADDNQVKDLELYFFEKLSVDTLGFIKQIKIDSVHIGVNHSGAPSQIVTKDNSSFLIYSKRYEIGQATPGNPTYIVKIDRNNLPDDNTIENNRTFIGNAGDNDLTTNPPLPSGADGHNYGSLTMDSQGYLHVVLSGHHDPGLKYTKSTIPLSITFEPIAIFGDESSTNNDHGHTYSSLICDQNDKLHCITRWSGDNYQFQIAYLTKSGSNDWSDISRLIIPFENNYHKWFHKLAIDSNNNLYLNYQLLHDRVVTDEAFATYSLEWPEDEIDLWNYDISLHNENMRPRFPAMLKLESTQNDWKLVTTPDFIDDISYRTTVLPNILSTPPIEKKDDILIYPNPSTNYINLIIPKSPNNESYANIYDLGGRKIGSIKLKQTSSIINISKLSKGIYLLEVTGNNKGVKIIIVK